MLARIAASAALIALAGCAGMDSAGRSALASPSAAAAPTPDTATLSQPPQAETLPPAAADAPASAPRSASDDTVVVPGAREQQVPAPGSDPRSTAERMQDIRAWDRCVMQVQSAAEADPMRPQLTLPEEYCSQTLGMSSRTSVPQSRLERR